MSARPSTAKKFSLIEQHEEEEKQQEPVKEEEIEVVEEK